MILRTSLKHLLVSGGVFADYNLSLEEEVEANSGSDLEMDEKCKSSYKEPVFGLSVVVYCRYMVV